MGTCERITEITAKGLFYIRGPRTYLRALDEWFSVEVSRKCWMVTLEETTVIDTGETRAWCVCYLAAAGSSSGFFRNPILRVGSHLGSSGAILQRYRVLSETTLDRISRVPRGRRALLAWLSKFAVPPRVKKKKEFYLSKSELWFRVFVWP